MNETKSSILAGFVIVDAEEVSEIVISLNSEGLTSEQLVCIRRMEFLKPSVL
ncbi:MAG: hypothetical protein QXQ41_01670 [Candidatus Bathyarchaeia archaeon]